MEVELARLKQNLNGNDAHVNGNNNSHLDGSYSYNYSRDCNIIDDGKSAIEQQLQQITDTLNSMASLNDIKNNFYNKKEMDKQFEATRKSIHDSHVKSMKEKLQKYYEKIISAKDEAYNELKRSANQMFIMFGEQ